MTANQDFFDAMIRHQIFLQRFAGSLRKQIIGLLNDTEDDLRKQVLRILPSRGSPPTPAQLRRVERLLVVVRSLRGDGWDKAQETWRQELLGLAKAQPEFVAGAIRASLPFPVELQIPSAQLLRALVTERPFEGKILKDHVRVSRAADLDRIESQIRIGMVQGESNQQIARRILGTRLLKGKDGITELTRHQVVAVGRTAVNHISNQVNREFFQHNAALFEQEVYVATLDGRTTPICRSLDGERFPVGEGPIPPRHHNCRSLRVAVIDDEIVGTRFAKPTTERMLVREFSRMKGLGGISTRRNLPRGTKGEFDAFARRRTRELIGKVPAKTTYGEWLKTQSMEFQDDVLGVTKARLFRKGNLTLDKFVNRAGDELTLEELAVKERQAFIAAGLDPDDFR